jgi:general stress protein YciG
MAENKKSFILYNDQRGIFKKLSDEQAGKLIKHIFSYVSDENPEADFITELAFESIKSALKRDLKKFEQIKEKRAEAGRKGGKQTQANQANASDAKQTQANQAVSDNDNDSDSVSVNDIYPKKDKQEKNASRLYFDDEILNDVFSKWLKMCKEKGKPYPLTSIEALQMKLTSQSTTKSINQVRQSLEKGWLNLRPFDETESKLSKQDEEEMDIAIIKHARNVLANDNNIDAPEDNRLRRIS